MARMAAGLLSYADLQRMPDDGRRYERQQGGPLLFAPSDVVFTQYNVIQPDLLCFTDARRHMAVAAARIFSFS